MAFALIQELIHRDGLRIALAGRDDVILEPIIRLLLKYVADPRFGELVSDVASIVLGMFIISKESLSYRSDPSLDMYAPVIGQAPLIDGLFLRLQKKITAELRFQEEIVKTKGALTMILSSTIS